MPIPAQLPLYRVMISCTHFGVLPTLLTQRNRPAIAIERCLSSATPHRLSPPIGPIGPIKEITPRRSEASAPPPTAETMTGGGHFRHPGRRWLPCETGYFADLGIGDMPGARARPQNRHPGGGGRPSATDS